MFTPAPGTGSYPSCLTPPVDKTSVHRLVRVNYTIRVGAFAWSAAVLALLGLERGFGPAFWALLALVFLVYPHLAYLRARSAASPKAAELSNLYLDSALLGAWIAGLGFPAWPAYAALNAASLNAIVLRGVRGVVTSIAAFAAGALVWMLVGGFEYSPATSTPISLLCFFGSLLYTCSIGYVEFVNNRRLVAAREALRESENRYRLITENAADLVAMVDAEGRWLYASPSCSRILGDNAVVLGADAFARAHPDDAEQARYAVRRVSVTGKSRDLVMRFFDRDGRVRQFKTHVQVVEPDLTEAGVPHHRLLVSSQDVTDLKESEERLLVAAHALEGMTEAILITSADGTVVTANHAFTQLTGFTRDDVLGRPEKEIRNGLEPAEFYDEVFLTVMRKGFWTGTAWGRRQNGSGYRERGSVRALNDMNGAVSHYVMVFFEVEAPSRNNDRASEA